MTLARRLRLSGLLVALSVPGIVLLGLATPAALEGLLADPPPAYVLALGTILQSLIITALFALMGSFMASRVGLSAPAIDAWFDGKDPRPILAGQFRAGLPAGMVAGAVIVALDHFVFRASIPAEIQLLSGEVTLQGVASALTYGGILEEVWMRWGLMSLLGWLLAFVTGRQRLGLALGMANLVVAILFGVGHFGAVAAAVSELTTPIMVRTIILNALPGLVFGVLYQRKGLESAMFAHMGAHVAMNLIRLLAM